MRLPLPLILVTAMLLIGAGIEAALYGRVLLIPKLPLALLLVWAFARPTPESRS